MSLEDRLIESVTEAVLAAIKPHINDPHRMMTEKEAMKLLGVSSEGTMRRMRQMGLVAYQPTGRQYFYFLDDVIAFVKRNGRAV